MLKKKREQMSKDSRISVANVERVLWVSDIEELPLLPPRVSLPPPPIPSVPPFLVPLSPG